MSSFSSLQATEIQRVNHLFTNDSIHLHTELKIPYWSTSKNSSPSSSPRLSRSAIRQKPREQTDGQLSSCENSYSEEEEEVKRKPLSLLSGFRVGLTDSGERDIKCLLDSVDEQLKISRNFAEKLAEKK